MQTGLITLVLMHLAIMQPPAAATDWQTVHVMPRHTPIAVRSHHRFKLEPHAGEDRWFAVDKVQHFAVSYGTAMLGYGVLRGAGATHGDARAAAIAGALAAGIGKELFDHSRGGRFSLKDLAWDGLGTLAAWGMISLNR